MCSPTPKIPAASIGAGLPTARPSASILTSPGLTKPGPMVPAATVPAPKWGKTLLGQ